MCATAPQAISALCASCSYFPLGLHSQKLKEEDNPATTRSTLALWTHLFLGETGKQDELKTIPAI